MGVAFDGIAEVVVIDTPGTCEEGDGIVLTIRVVVDIAVGVVVSIQ